MSERLVRRLRPHGESVFATMSGLALQHGAVNLGQGFPDDPAPQAVVEAARAALAAGHNQYPPSRGVPELREAVARHQREHYDLPVDPATGVAVTTGATGALAASVLGLVEPGDEVVTFEPAYDAYAALVDLAGGTLRRVPLRAPGLAVDADALAAACGPRTAVILLNSPHNPTGKVFTPAELELVAEQARQHDAVVVTDEVYEHMTFDGVQHVPMASLPGMWERTITISSAGKTFSVTGWKVGWASGAPELVEVIASTSQWLTFSGGAAYQPAVAEGLGRIGELVDPLTRELARRRDLLVDGLRAAGLEPLVPQGGYFVVADAAPIGVSDAMAWCLEIPQRLGVAAVPVSAFCESPAGVESLVRFAFCKSEDRIREGTARLRA
ncbi:aminotransferase class I/II-fold pyridoxal phosphate-dependent enzyme [Janibacter melonis]|uniref:Aminotransferase class I/II-fold pyridoxal phosphate-dependent enzyme n=1 Tax=Janibacter melonis TaxID=262209 RepID=A0A5P8FN17_9MICO|nr:aminotransferase class I/II-fold pyridoxal phosphate-dependent enzyme [Janibacter melonis]QFQ30533.1 aminotransferase class I/II-fold pyridoxal phosphate-dependent enzyme [Janibacter melonis]